MFGSQEKMRSLLIAAICMVPLLAFGMFGNLHLIYATVKFKQLQHRNGILVAIIAFLDFVSQIHEAKNAIEIFTGKSLMKRVNCNHSLVLYGFSFCMANIAMLFLAIDRLIAVLSPVKYRLIKSTRYITVVIAVGFVYSTPFVVIGFIVADETLVELCNPPTSYVPQIMVIWTYGYVSNAAIVVLINVVNFMLMLGAGKKRASYLLFFASDSRHTREPSLAILQLRFNAELFIQMLALIMDSVTLNTNMESEIRYQVYFKEIKGELVKQDAVYYQRQIQVTHSMLLMMILYGLTTLLAAFIIFVGNFLPITEQTMADITSFLCLLVLVNYGNNYYILFWRSRVYRTVFLSQFHRNPTISVAPSRTIQIRPSFLTPTTLSPSHLQIKNGTACDEERSSRFDSTVRFQQDATQHRRNHYPHYL